MLHLALLYSSDDAVWLICFLRSVIYNLRTCVMVV